MVRAIALVALNRTCWKYMTTCDIVGRAAMMRTVVEYRELLEHVLT